LCLEPELSPCVHLEEHTNSTNKTQFLPDQKPLLPKKNATFANKKGEVDGKKEFLGGNRFLVANVRNWCHLLPGKKGELANKWSLYTWGLFCSWALALTSRTSRLWAFFCSGWWGV
jgi:hypothetical protein